MKKYEYKSRELIFSSEEADFKELDTMLSEKGKEGWELVSVISEFIENVDLKKEGRKTYLRTYTFKKEIIS